MTDQRELRATSDVMLQLLDRIRAAEEVKRGLPTGTGEFAGKAFEVLELTRTAVRWAELQMRQANELMARQPESDRALADVRPRRLDQVLAEWRQAEIRYSQIAPDSPDATPLAGEVERLRAEYRELQARKLADHANGA